MNILEAVKINSFQTVTLAQYLFFAWNIPRLFFLNNSLMGFDSVGIIYLY